MSRECVFCGAPATSSEHVWPDWLNRFLDTTGGFQTESGWAAGFGTEPKRQSRHGKLNVKVKAFCGDCNRHWMSDIETDAASILKPMIRGQQRTIMRLEQTRLARWIWKTAFTAETLYPLERRSIWPEDFLEFRKNDLPDAGLSIFIGLAMKDAKNDLWHRSTPLWPRRRTRGPQPFGRGYVSTIQINHFVGQAMRIQDGPATVVASGEMAKVVYQIWPVFVPVVTYPPKQSLTRARWRALSNAWVDTPGHGGKPAG